jgi:hypothetical protein
VTTESPTRSGPTSTPGTYEVRAQCWQLGWHLHIQGVGTAQSTTMAAAERMVREHLHSARRSDAHTATITFVDNTPVPRGGCAPDVAGLDDAALDAEFGRYVHRYEHSLTPAT